MTGNLSSLWYKGQLYAASEIFVWRLQDAKGRGPWNSEVQNEAFKKKLSKIYSGRGQGALDPEKYFSSMPPNDYSYGFEKLEHVKYWFTRKQLHMLESLGITLHRVKAKNVIKSTSEKQVAFQRG